MLTLGFFITDILKKGALGLLLMLDAIVYNLIGQAYGIFMAIAGARLLSEDAYMAVANKVYALVGVLMLFVLSYSILRSIIDPDKNLKEELGAKLVQRIMIAVVGLALTPVIFNLLYQGQALILESNILGNLFFNDEVLEDGTDPNSYLTQIGGNVTATSLWQAFFHPDSDTGLESDEIKADLGTYLSGALALGGCVAGAGALAAGLWAVPVLNLLLIGATAYSCIKSANDFDEAASTDNTGEITLREAYARTSAGDNFNIYIAFLDNIVDDGEVEYLFIISTIAGGYCLYAFISFSIDMGVRAAKMAYLQVIAPIPLIMQVMNSNDGMFKKYLEHVKNTFMEVFIRISVVYITVYIICHIPSLFSSTAAIWGNTDLTALSKLLALALLILGLIAFCRKAPEIIGDTLNIKSGDLKLGLHDKLANGGAFAAGGIAGASATSAVHGFKNGLGKGGNGWSKAGHALAGGARGLFGGGARAAWNQFGPGEDKHEAKSWKDTKNVATRASRQEDDAQEARDSRRNVRENIQKRIEKLQQDRDAAAEALKNNTDPAKHKELAKKVQDIDNQIAAAQKEAMANTEVGNFLNERGKRIKIWATGSFDLSVEDSAIKLGGAAGDLQDKLRGAIAAKGSDELKAAKKTWDDLEAEKVDKYKNGYTEESYNEELRKRRAAINGGAEKANLDSKVTIANQKKAAWEAAVRSGDATAIAAAKTEYDTAVADVTSAQQAYDSAMESVRTQLDSEAKLSERELSDAEIELQHKRSDAKKVYEMMADAEIQVKLAGGEAEYVKMVTDFLKDNVDIIENHPNTQIPIEVDANGKVTKSISVSEFITENYGSAALTGQFDASHFSTPQDVVIEYSDNDGNPVKAKMKFNPETKKYTEMNFDPNTNDYTIEGSTYSPGEIAVHLRGLAGKNSALSSLDINTGINTGKSKGKKIKTVLPTTADYISKTHFMREKEEHKK